MEDRMCPVSGSACRQTLRHVICSSSRTARGSEGCLRARERGTSPRQPCSMLAGPKDVGEREAAGGAEDPEGGCGTTWAGGSVLPISIRRLVSRFRTGCHGLQVDTDRWFEGVDMDRGCLVCNSPGCVEDEQLSIFDCPAYNHIRVMHMNLFQYFCTVADFLSSCEPNACGGHLRDCFACRKEILSV